jgi:Protein of unknown function (DUF3298).
MFKRAALFIAGLLFFSAVNLYAQTETKVFRGGIGENRFQMTLRRAGGKLSGSYFYTKIGAELKLIGTIDGEGKFVLTETDAKGLKTGEFSGVWSRDEEARRFTLSGTWKNAKGTKSLDFYATEQMIFFSGQEKLLTKTFSESNKPKMFDISADYPQIAGVEPAAAAKFNEVVKTLIDRQTNRFRKMMLEQTAEDLKFARERGVSNYLEISYHIEHADERFVSIGFFASTYTGGAHPNHYSFTLNFDVKNKRELKLADLFKPNSAYLEKISAYSIARLIEKLEEGSDEEWIRNGAGAKEENYKSWSLTREGLLINFDPYQVAAYAAGPQEVLVPFAELKNIAREGGAIEVLMK